MKRRTYLTGIAGVTAGLAGCSGVLGGDGGDDGDGSGSEPQAAYRAFWQAIDDGDRERVEELIHPNARSVSEPPEGVADGNGDVEVGETEVVEREHDRAIVVGELTFQTENGETEGPIRFDLEFRTHDGKWKYYHGMDWGA